MRSLSECSQDWFVHKFGGTSCGSAERYINVSRLTLLVDDLRKNKRIKNLLRSSTELFYAERDQFSSYLNTLYDPLLNKDDKTEIKKVLLCVCLKFELLCEMFAQ